MSLALCRHGIEAGQGEPIGGLAPVQRYSKIGGNRYTMNGAAGNTMFESQAIDRTGDNHRYARTTKNQRADGRLDVQDQRYDTIANVWQNAGAARVEDLPPLEPERLEEVSAQVGRRLALLVLWAVVTVSSGSSLAVRVLFGVEYLPGGPALAVLAWGGLFAATGTLVLHGMVAAGRQRLLLAANLGATANAVVLQLVLVPRFLLLGSAVATVAALASGQLLLALVPASRPAVAASWRAALPVISTLNTLLDSGDEVTKIGVR